MRIINAVKIEVKGIVKRPIIYILIGLATIYNVYIYRTELISSNSLNFIKSTVYCTQVLILGFIILGIYMSRREIEGNMNEILQGINSAIFIKLLSKVLVLLMSIGVFGAVNYIIIKGIFKTDYNYNMMLVKYIFIYWITTFLIAGLIGYIIDNIFKGKIVYIVSIVIWFLITPINHYIFNQLGIMGIESAFKWANFFNICQDNINNPINLTYGLSVEKYQIYQRLFLISILLVIIMIILYKKRLQTKKTFVYSIVVLMCFVGIGGFNTFTEQQVLVFDLEAEASRNKDRIDYENIEAKKAFEVNFEVKKYDINLDIDKKLKADVSISLENISSENQEEIQFLLYHELKVSEVVFNNEEVEFNQDFDNLNIKLDKKAKSGEEIIIRIQYEGVTSPKNFANSEAIYLSNTYPYIPVISEYDAVMSMDKLSNVVYRHNIYNGEDIQYNLKINNGNDIYTNLNKISENQWSGNSDNGIYLLKGAQIESKINDKTVIYPLNLEGKTDVLESRVKLVNDATNLINKWFNLDINIERVMLVDTTYIDYEAFPSNKGFFVNGDLILPVREFERGDFFDSLVASLTWKHNKIDDENFRYLQVFDYSVAFLLEKSLLEESENSMLEMYVTTLELNEEMIVENKLEIEKDIKPVKKIYDFLNNEKIDKRYKIEFLENWYKEIDKKEGLENIAMKVKKYER